MLEGLPRTSQRERERKWAENIGEHVLKGAELLLLQHDGESWHGIELERTSWKCQWRARKEL